MTKKTVITAHNNQHLSGEQRANQIEPVMQNHELTLGEGNVEKPFDRYIDLYDFAPVGYVTIGRDSAIHSMNQIGADLLGVERSKLLKQRLVLFVPIESRPVFNAFLEKVFISGEKQSCDLAFEKEDRNLRWVQIEAICTDGQECKAVLVDATARKQSEHILQARLRLLHFAVTHPLVELLQATLDELETLTGSQIGFYHFLEADQETLLLQTWSTRTLGEMCTAEGAGRHYNVSNAGIWVECIRAGKAVIHNDYPALPASHRKGLPAGHAAVLRELVVPVFRGSKIVAILGVGNKPSDYNEYDVESVSNLADLAWDIAEKKVAEEALKKSRSFLAEIEKIGSVGGWEFDVITREQIWTEETYHIHEVGMDFQPTVDKGINFYTPSSRLIIERAVLRAIQNGEPFEKDLEITTAKGNHRWVNVIGKVDAQHHRVYGFFQDISERKQVENEIIQLNATLEKRIEERTFDLQSANSALEKALHAKDEFLAMMSHELRTPLTGILGLAQVLMLKSYGELNQKQLAATENIEKSGHRLLELINEILDYSILQTGKSSLQHLPCSLGSVCSASLLAVSSLAEQKNQILRFSISPDSIIINADERRIRQILSNLLSNAIKFTPNGGSIEIQVTGNAKSHLVRISVSDTGIGIQPDEFQGLFQPFHQLDARLSRAYAGTGLGLAIVKTLLKCTAAAWRSKAALAAAAALQ